MNLDCSVVFDRNWKEYDQWYDRHPDLYNSELQAVKKSLPSQGLGLEIGVGSGRFSAPLSIPVGLDPSLNMLRAARKRNLKVVQGRGEYLPFQKEAFHFILIVITLCFVHDPLKMLKEVNETLKKGGELILAMIDKESSWGQFYEKKASRNLFYKEARFHSVPQVLEMLRRAHLEFKNAWQTLHHPPPHIPGTEQPRKGYGQGGFVVLSAVKK